MAGLRQVGQIVSRSVPVRAADHVNKAVIVEIVLKAARRMLPRNFALLLNEPSSVNQAPLNFGRTVTTRGQTQQVTPGSHNPHLNIIMRILRTTTVDLVGLPVVVNKYLSTCQVVRLIQKPHQVSVEMQIIQSVPE